MGSHSTSTRLGKRLRNLLAPDSVNWPTAVMPEYSAAEAGKAAEDLFLYPVERVNLVRGQVGYFPLFTESMPYKHIYQWKIPDYVNEQDMYSYDRRRREQREPEEEVWHTVLA